MLRAYLGLTRAADAVAPIILRRRLRRGKEDAARLDERLGRPGLVRPKGPLLWFHAASVGESLSLLTLLARIKAARPDAGVLITTGTRTSADLIAQRLPEGVMHQFVPLDTVRAVTRFLGHWRPDVAVWTESELWPRLIVETAARGVPMLLINARISPNSAANWRRAPRMMGALLARFDAILTQDEVTAQVVRGFGAGADRVTVAGTLKQESAVLPCDEAELLRLRSAIGARALWLAASTHPGEEEIVARAHAGLLTEHPDLLLILAPRHPDRAATVTAALSARGLDHALRSTGALPDKGVQVYVADTLGEMGLWYRLAQVAFIGGSLAPIGGHNPYEPAALGAAMITGPHVQNFNGVFADLDHGGGVIRVRDAASLEAAVSTLLEPGRASDQARRARTICNAGGGATERALAAILSHLPAPVSP
jgi:3-deoxy-D-manno-octulosonic-acid transferase